MASISDVFDALNDIKGKLDQLHADALNNGVKLDNLTGVVDHRLVDVLQQQLLTNKLVHHVTLQQTAILCAVEHVSRNTCALVNVAELDLEQSRAIREQTRTTAEVLKSVHADAALALAHRDELASEIEACCPPDEAEPACEYKACRDPGQFKMPKLPEVEKRNAEPK